jgi:hypothetical protein
MYVIPPVSVCIRAVLILICISYSLYHYFCSRHAAKPLIVTKTVHLVVPPWDIDHQPVTKTITFCSSEELRQYCSVHHFSIRDPATNHVVFAFEHLVSGQIYVANGAYATPLKRSMEQDITDAIFEREVALAVQRSVGSDARIYPLVAFILQGKYHSSAAIVVHDCDASKTSTAYIIKMNYLCAGGVAELLSTVEAFKAWVVTSYRFKAVTKFVPVLGSRCFSEETISECITHNVSRLALSDAGFEWVDCTVFDPTKSDDLRAKELQLGAEEVALRDDEPTSSCMIYRLCPSCLQPSPAVILTRVSYLPSIA